MEPFPENLYPLEYTTAKVTCIAFDASGEKVPEKILFMRRDDLNNYKELNSSYEKFSFTRTTEEQGEYIHVQHTLSVCSTFFT